MKDDELWYEFREPIDNKTASILLGDKYEEGYNYLLVTEPGVTTVSYMKNNNEIVERLVEEHTTEVPVNLPDVSDYIRTDLVSSHKSRKIDLTVYLLIITAIAFLIGIGLIILLKRI